MKKRLSIGAVWLAAAVFITMGGPRAAAAQPRFADRLDIDFGSRMGIAQSLYPRALMPGISGLVTSLLFHGRALIAPDLAVQLRIPLVFAGVDLPAGGAQTKTALGHPEAALLWRTYQTATAVLFTRIAVAAPLGTDDASFGQKTLGNEALLLASAQRGWHDKELYAPGRLSVTPAARADVASGWLRGFAELKAPLMLAVVRGTSDPLTTVAPFAMSTALGAGAAVSYWRMRLGVAPWTVFDIVPASEIRNRSASRWALSVDPNLEIRITDRVSAAISATLPVAGALKGSPALGLGVAGTL